MSDDDWAQRAIRMLLARVVLAITVGAQDVARLP